MFTFSSSLSHRLFGIFLNVCLRSRCNHIKYARIFVCNMCSLCVIYVAQNHRAHRRRETITNTGLVFGAIAKLQPSGRSTATHSTWQSVVQFTSFAVSLLRCRRLINIRIRLKWNEQQIRIRKLPKLLQTHDGTSLCGRGNECAGISNNLISTPLFLLSIFSSCCSITQLHRFHSVFATRFM